VTDAAPDFGPGSRGAPYAPTPGWAYVGDAWCGICASYVPTEGARGSAGPVYRFSAHGCRGDLAPAPAPRQHEEESE